MVVLVYGFNSMCSQILGLGSYFVFTPFDKLASMTDLTLRLKNALEFDESFHRRRAHTLSEKRRRSFDSRQMQNFPINPRVFLIGAQENHARTKALMLALVSVYDSTLKTYHGSQMKEECAICQSLAAVLKELERLEGGV